MSLEAENKALKKEMEYEKNESYNTLSQVYRLQTKIEEIKRMENEEYDKVIRDEVKLKKELDEVKLKFKRSSDELSKVKSKQEEIENLRSYFMNKKQSEEQESVQQQLKYESEKLSLLGLIRHKNKKPLLLIMSYLNLPELNKVSMLNKSYRRSLCNDCTFVWKSVYRAINLSHFEVKQQLEHEIKLKAQEIKNIVPMKKVDIIKIAEDQSDMNLQELLQTYVVSETKVGE